MLVVLMIAHVFISVAGFKAMAADIADDSAIQLLRLEQAVDRAAGIRAAKRLQRSYAQFSQFGLWGAMADLFASDGRLDYGLEHAVGRDAIHTFLRDRLGHGHEGLGVDEMHLQMNITPVVTLAADGNSAQGRWHQFSMLGGPRAGASWAGGVLIADYVRETGVWKISRLSYHPQFAGAYATGWRNLLQDTSFIPYRFTPEEVGRPIPPIAEVNTRTRPADDAQAAQRLRRLEQRLSDMQASDTVRNLQNAYGYYVDRKMWDDVVDLFADDAVLRIAGLGAYHGRQNIRRALERDGPAGLRPGELNDHMQIGSVVTIAPGGHYASARGLQLTMAGHNGEWAQWAEAVFENVYRNVNGVWVIQEMTLFPKMRADYDLGWASGRLPEPEPSPAQAPDDSTGAPVLPSTAPWLPTFSYQHPVTGEQIAAPAGTMPVAIGSNVPVADDSATAPTSDADLQQRLARANTALAIIEGYDAAENLSSAFGWYDDDGFGDGAFWTEFAELFAEDAGRAMPAVGIYRGPARIRQVELELHGAGRDTPRRSIPLHMRVQPVIHVAADGRSANIRSRLFQTGSNYDRPSGFTGGMYEDKAVKRGDRWLFSLVEIDHVWRTPGYKAGWARVPENFGVRKPSPLLTTYPPDEPPRGITFAPFPSIGPMWFHYRNPVSGRVPENYWP